MAFIKEESIRSLENLLINTNIAYKLKKDTFENKNKYKYNINKDKNNNNNSSNNSIDINNFELNEKDPHYITNIVPLSLFGLQNLGETYYMNAILE